MKKLLLPITFLLCCTLTATAQFAFPVDTLLKAGRLDNRINIVLLPDGYQASEMNKFRTDATAFMNAMLNTIPFAQYQSYFNFFLIQVPSNQSGATHPGNAADEGPTPITPIETKDTYFGSRFDSFGIHRLVTTTQFTRFTNVMATNFPDYDLAVMLVNSPHYGGSGGTPSIATVNSASTEIAIHEVGHTFVGLADEYWAGAQYASESTNMTQNNNTATIRWRNWLNTTNIGVYAHTPPGQNWYKPANGTCKMEALNRPFCNVCRETFTYRFLDLVRPIDAFVPATANVTVNQQTTFRLTPVLPNPNTIRTEWRLNGQVIAGQQTEINIEPAALIPGQNYSLTVQMLDTTAFLRRDNHPAAHTQTISWTLQRTNCTTQQTVRAGDWHDPAVWSCGSVPTSDDLVVVAHQLTVSADDALARQVTFQNGGVIRYVQNRRLRLAN